MYFRDRDLIVVASIGMCTFTNARCVPSFASLSASSLPIIPTWLGIHTRLKLCLSSMQVFTNFLTSGPSLFEETEFKACRLLSESVNIVIVLLSFLKMFSAHTMAAVIAVNSAAKIDELSGRRYVWPVSSSST